MRLYYSIFLFMAFVLFSRGSCRDCYMPDHTYVVPLKVHKSDLISVGDTVWLETDFNEAYLAEQYDFNLEDGEFGFVYHILKNIATNNLKLKFMSADSCFSRLQKTESKDTFPNGYPNYVISIDEKDDEYYLKTGFVMQQQGLYLLTIPDNCEVHFKGSDDCIPVLQVAYNIEGIEKRYLEQFRDSIDIDDLYTITNLGADTILSKFPFVVH